MPSLKEIKTRIASVNSTRKITSAMKMVASSKLHRSQSAIESMLPYEGMLEHILRSFLEATPEIETPYNQERPIKRVALIVYSSSSSLCGGFNTNIIKAMHNAVRSYNEKGFSNKDIVIYTIGRKVYEKAKKMGYTVVNLYSDLAEKPSLERARQLSTEVCQKWIEGDFDKVELIYHHFKSAGTQILTRKTFLPIEINLNNGNDKNNGSVSLEKSSDNEEQSLKDLSKDYFLVEPDIKTVLNTLIPRLLDNMIYTASLDLSLIHI